MHHNLFTYEIIFYQKYDVLTYLINKLRNYHINKLLFQLLILLQHKFLKKILSFTHSCALP